MAGGVQCLGPLDRAATPPVPCRAATRGEARSPALAGSPVVDDGGQHAGRSTATASRRRPGIAGSRHRSSRVADERPAGGATRRRGSAVAHEHVPRPWLASAATPDRGRRRRRWRWCRRGRGCSRTRRKRQSGRRPRSPAGWNIISPFRRHDNIVTQRQGRVNGSLRLSNGSQHWALPHFRCSGWGWSCRWCGSSQSRFSPPASFASDTKSSDET
jgi:hypothetical protein